MMFAKLFTFSEKKALLSHTWFFCYGRENNFV